MTITCIRNMCSSVSAEMRSKLLLYQFRKKGREISFDEFFKRTDWPATWGRPYIASDNKGFVSAALPDYAVKFERTGHPLNLFGPISFTPLERAIKKKNIPEVKRLIGAGADVNARGYGYQSPLFRAVRTGKVSIVNLLMSSGADAYACEKMLYTYNFTAYHYALQLHHYSIVRHFIEKWKVPFDQYVPYHDYGNGLKAIDFAKVSPEADLSPYKFQEAERIIALLDKLAQEKEVEFAKAVQLNYEKLGEAAKKKDGYW